MTTTIAPSVRPRFGLTERNVWNSAFYARTNGETGEVYDPQGFLFATTPDPHVADIIVDAMNEEDVDFGFGPDDDDEAYLEAVESLVDAAKDLIFEVSTVYGAPKGLCEKSRALKEALAALALAEETRQ